METKTFHTDIHVPEHIFRAYDIRGMADKELMPQNMYLIGKAIGSEAYERNLRTLVTARDGRLSGPILYPALKQGLMDAGCNLLDIEDVPTPLMYYANYQLLTSAGVMLTGSHNPPQYNGVKIVMDNRALAEDDIKKLYQRIQTGNLRSGGRGEERKVPMIDTYMTRVCADVILKKPLRLVVDCGNGIAGKIAPKLFRMLGCYVREMYCTVDGRFPGHHPDPSKPHNLTELRVAVKESNADLGLAFDGDGDRLGVVDTHGDIIWPDRQLMLFAMDVLKRYKGATILYDVKCSRHLASVIKQHGGVPYMWKTGHSLVKSKMREIDAMLAGEFSGHMFLRERWYGFDDAIYAAARLLELLAEGNPQEILTALPNSISSPEISITLDDARKFTMVERLCAEGEFPGGESIFVDGIRVEYPDGWGLMRASNTNPCMVARFEADTTEALERIKEIFRQQLRRLEPAMVIPF